MTDTARQLQYFRLLSEALERKQHYIDTETDNGNRDPHHFGVFDERVNDFNSEIAYLADVYVNNVT